MTKTAPLYELIYDLVRQIPPGKVATYGQIAAIVGRCSARQVGFAMSATPAESDIPWQRVINSQGRISPHGGGEGSGVQREILEMEGVVFNASGRTDLSVFGWGGPDFEIDAEEFDERTLF
ncbi:MAG: MGMT family protein [FCB group bacterium]|nr:MGMT family protein [FCB group bacterium]